MRQRSAFFLIAALPLTFAGVALSQTPPPAATAPSNTAPAGGAAAASYVMTMGDMMNTLIQPRHTKLGLAGKAGNWELATYAAAEIRQSFVGIAKAQPKFAGMPVGTLVEVAIDPPMKAVDAAIKAQDAQKFAAAYDQLTQGCNACHMELNHPYVVIRTPDATSFPDQDFSPKH
jgi:hypothetical protein